MIYDINNKDLVISKKQEFNINLFWGGFIMYMVGYTLCSKLINNVAQLQIIQIAGIMLFMFAAVNIIKFKIKNEYLRIFFFIYILWSIGIIARGFSFEFWYIKELLFDSGLGIFMYLVPLVILFPQNMAYYRKFFTAALILSGFQFLFTALFIKDLFNPDRESILSQGIVEYFTGLGFTISFILLTYIYHQPKKKLFAFGMMILSLLCVVYRARRGWIFMHIITLLAFLMIYLIVSKKTVLVTYLAIIIILIGFLFYSNIYNQKNFGVFNFLIERGSEDTRSYVEIMFFEDMQIKDWLIGRGIKGEYYCPDIDEFSITGYRNVIETGYLQIILKGGIIGLALFLLILIPASINGLFNSKNILSKASGMWILLWLLFLYPMAANSFSLEYILVWMAAGICFSKKIRNMTDEQIAEYLSTPEKVSSNKRKKELNTELI